MTNSTVDLAARIMYAAMRADARERVELPNERWAQLMEIMVDIPQRPPHYQPLIIPPSKTDPYIVVLVSGGLDSTVAYWKAYEALNAHRESAREVFPMAVYVQAGQPYGRAEMDALNSMDISFSREKNSIWFNFAESSWEHIQPGRNFLYLAYAAEYLESDGAVWLGATEGEIEPGGDKSHEFFRLASEILSEAMPWHVDIGLPCLTMTKGDEVRWLIDKKGLDYARKTYSCFTGYKFDIEHTPDGGRKASVVRGPMCGRCQACLRRYLAFWTAGHDVVSDYEVCPIIGAVEHVNRYLERFKIPEEWHYTPRRIEEDTKAILDARRQYDRDR